MLTGGGTSKGDGILGLLERRETEKAISEYTKEFRNYVRKRPDIFDKLSPEEITEKEVEYIVEVFIRDWSG